MRCRLIESENGEQCRVDAPLLFGGQMAGEMPESVDVDGAQLFDQDAGRYAVDLDLGPKRRRPGTARRGCHQHDGPW